MEAPEGWLVTLDTVVGELRLMLVDELRRPDAAESLDRGIRRLHARALVLAGIASLEAAAELEDGG